MNHPTNPVADDTRTDEEYAMPSAEALLASSLALMTGYAQGCCDSHRTQMAQKIVDNLATLCQHPLLSPDFQTLLWNLHTRWTQQLHASAAVLPPQAASTQAALWHKAAEVLQ